MRLNTCLMSKYNRFTNLNDSSGLLALFHGMRDQPAKSKDLCVGIFSLMHLLR
jgi:hypothetical protein